MTAIQIIENPTPQGKRSALVLTEDRVGHYPELREFFVREFSLAMMGSRAPVMCVLPRG
jgi:hypothetical protein